MYFSDKTQFNFTLHSDSAILESVKCDKIHLFSLGKIDSNHLPHILLNGTDNFLIGGLIYGNANAWYKFNERIREALNAFASFQIMDDDQKLHLWVARNYPNECAIYKIDAWFSGLFYFIPAYLREKIKVSTPSILQTQNLQVQNLNNVIAIPPPLKNTIGGQNLTKSQNLRDEFRTLRQKCKRVLCGLLRHRQK